MILLSAALGLATASAVAQQNRLVSACATCHPTQAAAAPLTPMGRALEMPGHDPQLNAHPKLTFRKGAYTYTIKTANGQSTYSVTDGQQTITLPLNWHFGFGSQSWVLEYQGRPLEGLVSYYPEISGLDITTGDEALQPKTLEEAVGRKLAPSEVKSCFGCHATNTAPQGMLDPKGMEPGVQCEHCHTGIERHLLAEANGDADPQSFPPALGALNSEQISNFCGRCHRTWETVVRGGLRGVNDVRFQPYRLANSKCFIGNDPRISCLACHDPHKAIARDEASYDPKCLACHGQAAANSAPGTSTQAKICPVAKANCASCHMPKVPLPNGHMIFHDHYIRVVKAGEPYPY